MQGATLECQFPHVDKVIEATCLVLSAFCKDSLELVNSCCTIKVKL